MLKHQMDEVAGFLLGGHSEALPKRAALSLVDADLASRVDLAVTASALSGGDPQPRTPAGDLDRPAARSHSDG